MLLLLAAALTVVFPARAEAAASMRTLSLGGKKLEYCANGSLTSTSAQPKFTRVVLVSHGSSHNACDYARYVEDSAARRGVASSTLVIAPHFRERSSSSVLHWGSGWREGDLSRNGSPRQSSFAAIDALLRRVADRDRFPNVGRIVVTGHSAGGQVVQRYAAANSSGVAVTRYVVANPSSYVYFDDKRWAGGERRALTSSEKSRCSGWDTWKYGTASGLNSYAGSVGRAGLEARYRSADVTYLLGERDDDASDSSMDRSCEAGWQGAHRLQRGRQYHAYMSEDPATRHTLSVVAGVGHSGGSMYRSPEGQRALFE